MGRHALGNKPATHFTNENLNVCIFLSHIESPQMVDINNWAVLGVASNKAIGIKSCSDKNHPNFPWNGALHTVLSYLTADGSARVRAEMRDTPWGLGTGSLSPHQTSGAGVGSPTQAQLPSMSPGALWQQKPTNGSHRLLLRCPSAEMLLLPSWQTCQRSQSFKPW